MIKNNLPTLITGIIGYSFVIAICSQQALYHYSCIVSKSPRDLQFCSYDLNTRSYKVDTFVYYNPFNRN